MKHYFKKIILPGLIFLSLFTSTAYSQNKDKVAAEKERAPKKSEDRKLENKSDRSSSKDTEIRIERHTPRELKIFDGDSLIIALNADTIIRRFHKQIDEISDRIMVLPRGDIKISIPDDIVEIKDGSEKPSSNSSKRNSQSFSYNYTDKDGVASKMNIRVSEATSAQIKGVTGSESISKTLSVEDLTLFPNFSSGKMTLSFNLASKGNTSVKVLDSNFKTVFSDQSSGDTYFKQLNMFKNGVYYIHIKQGAATVVKQVVKN